MPLSSQLVKSKVQIRHISYWKGHKYVIWLNIWLIWRRGWTWIPSVSLTGFKERSNQIEDFKLLLVEIEMVLIDSKLVPMIRHDVQLIPEVCLSQSLNPNLQDPHFDSRFQVKHYFKSDACQNLVKTTQNEKVLKLSISKCRQNQHFIQISWYKWPLQLSQAQDLAQVPTMLLRQPKLLVSP